MMGKQKPDQGDQGNVTAQQEAEKLEEGSPGSQAEAWQGHEVDVQADAVENLRARIRELEDEVDRWQREGKAHYDRFLRERADLENVKKRAAREREEAVRYGTEALVRDLLHAIDNLERAVQHAAAGGNGQPLLEGVTLVLNGLVETLGRHGVTCIPALGQRFDPERHEAMEQVESDEHEPNTVVREHQKGYMLHDRLIRPALVGVSRPAVRRGEKETDSGGENHQ